MKVVIVGNCHIYQIAESLEFILSHKVDCVRDPLALRDNAERRTEVATLINSADIIGVMSSFWDDFITDFPEAEMKSKLIPHIRASAFHPDIVGLTLNGKRIESPMEVSHSRIVLFGYLQGLDSISVKSLFEKKMYNLLGYFDEWDKDIIWAKHQSSITGWDVESMYNRWRNSGCFVHTPNHPKLMVFSTIALEFAKINKLDIKLAEVRDLMIDKAAAHSIWPVYPHISELFNVYGNFSFKPLHKGKNITIDKSVTITLDEFIEKSYLIYKEMSLSINDLSNSLKLDFNKMEQYLKSKSNKVRANPYQGLPDYCYWKRSITKVKSLDVDPVVRAKFKISSNSKVATAGSCFAQHISRALSEQNFNYYVAETAPENIGSEEAHNKNYGVFSARFGNIYSTTQLLQLFKRAYKQFLPSTKCLKLSNGRFVDPFRPYVEPDGYLSANDVNESMEEHLDCVRKMFENLDFFVFTLGLTEGWKSKEDGAVFPVSPGVVSSNIDIENYIFFNMTTEEIVSDLTVFRELLKSVNPKAKIILTVSPVPLIATYEDRHVLVSTTYSKAALCVAADEMNRRFNDVMYFPSYEIITGNFNKGEYYEDDLRGVKTIGVQHVMRLFMKHCVVEEQDDLFLRDKIESAKVVCDEENIDN